MGSQALLHPPNQKYKYINPRSEPIVFNETTCCGNPPGLQWVMERGRYFIDGDCVDQGQYLMCPDHPDHVIYVFGTDWWQALGGTFEKNPVKRFHCPGWEEDGQVHHHSVEIEFWSYRG